LKLLRILNIKVKLVQRHWRYHDCNNHRLRGIASPD